MDFALAPFSSTMPGVPIENMHRPIAEPHEHFRAGRRGLARAHHGDELARSFTAQGEMHDGVVPARLDEIDHGAK